jgi:pimeloyl-ACP methyl ester carboxylesterase
MLESEHVVEITAKPKTYVLVHGAFFGGWCWKDVATGLRTLGHCVYTPTLTGLGERSHILAARPTLETFIEDIAQVFRFEDLNDVVLVGHSFAGSIVSALADRMPDKLRHLVYLDGQLLLPGQSPASGAPSESIVRYRRRAVETTYGPVIPPFDPEAFGVTDPHMAAWITSKLTPQPFQTYFDSLELKNALGNGLPATYIACTNPRYANVAVSHELAKRMEGWTYVEFPTGHNAMLSMPGRLATTIAAIG